MQMLNIFDLQMQGLLRTWLRIEIPFELLGLHLTISFFEDQ